MFVSNCDDSCDGKGLTDDAGCFTTCGECGERTGQVYVTNCGKQLITNYSHNDINL